MPYVSQAQERFFHTDTARKKGITPKMVKEFDTASKGKRLPKRAKNKGKKLNPGDLFNKHMAKMKKKNERG